ncbi:MAG: DMT family transporter [Betaproteobacteria bacterium]|nr:DMT family transporter [Betaproteobacteria bacterium]
MASSLIWLWIPITLWAAFAQTVRNVAQKNLTKAHGTLPATLVRFIYGLPFAVAWLLAVMAWSGAPLPAVSPNFFIWVVSGAVGQILGTAALLAAMERTNFAVASAYSKTEVLQVAVFAVVLLGEAVSLASAVAIVIATSGVVLLSAKDARSASGSAWLSKAAIYGMASGAFFAIAAVGFRGGTVALAEPNPAIAGAYTLVWAQSIQSVLLGGYLYVRQKEKLAAVLGAWRMSMLAGFMGAAASAGWFTAFAMRNAPDVRALGLIEVLFSYAIAHRLFGERTTVIEGVGMALLVAGLAVICLQL